MYKIFENWSSTRFDQIYLNMMYHKYFLGFNFALAIDILFKEQLSKD